MRPKKHRHQGQLDVFGYRPDDEPVPVRPAPSELPVIRIEPPRKSPPAYRRRPPRKPLGILPRGAPVIPVPPPDLTTGYGITLDIEPEYDVEMCVVHPRGAITHRRRDLLTDSEIEWYVAAIMTELSPRRGTRIVASDRTRGIRWILTYAREEWACVVRPCPTSSPLRKSLLA